MPTWGEILRELGNTPAANGTPDFDVVRRKYLAQLAAYTQRSVILYTANFLPSANDPNAVSINLIDQQAMMEVVRGLPGPNLDLILHTPGGSAEAVEAFVNYLRSRFDHIRAFVPLTAMSAGTMWALACDQVVMGPQSQLGPIDPQLAMAFGEQIRFTPAQAILDQFERAKSECQDPKNLMAWLPLLRAYGPSLLAECARSQQLSKSLVTTWLTRYMFKNRQDPPAEAARTAEFFADHTIHNSHSRPITRDLARQNGVDVMDLESDKQLQDLVLSVHHAAMHTFGATPTAKIVENHLGRAYVIRVGPSIQIVQGPPVQAQPTQPPFRTIKNPSQPPPKRHPKQKRP